MIRIDILRTQNNILEIAAAANLTSLTRSTIGKVSLMRHQHLIITNVAMRLTLLGRLLLVLLLMIQIYTAISLNLLSFLIIAILRYLMHLKCNWSTCWRSYNRLALVVGIRLHFARELTY